MTDDPFIHELVDHTPFAEEVARHADDPVALQRILDELLKSAPKEQVDDYEFLSQLDSVPEGGWPVVPVAHRFTNALFAYHGRAVMSLRASEVRGWLKIRLNVHHRFPIDGAFVEHIRGTAPEALNAAEIAVMMANNLSAYYGKPAASLSSEEVIEHVRFVI